MALPNVSPATAVDITLDWTGVIDITDATVVAGAWYKFTTNAFIYLLSMQVANDHAYTPSMILYKSDGVTRAGTLSGLVLAADWAHPVNQQVLPSTVYYLKVLGDVAAPALTTATFTIQENPVQAIAAGTILIPNDEEEFPALAMTMTGTVLRALPFSTGENSDILPTGVILADTRDATDSVVGTLELRNTDATFSVITSVVDPLGVSDEYAITTDQSTKFWVAGSRNSFGSFQFTSISPTGVVGGTTYSPTPHKVNYIAVKLDNSLLYFTTRTAAEAVHTFDILGNADGADFTAGIASFIAQDILVLSDGTLVIAYKGSPDLTTSFVRHCSAAGATLRDFPLTAGYYHDRLCRNGSSASDFIWWQQGSTNPVLHHIQRMRVSDGVAADSFTQSAYETGVADPPGTDRFGASKSCPILVLMTAIAAPITWTPPIIPPPLKRWLLHRADSKPREEQSA